MKDLHPVAWDTLVDYWAGDLAPDALDPLEEHLLGCQACSELSERAAAITETLRAQIPAVISGERLAREAARGLRVADNPMQPGERREVPFPADADLLIHRLGGLALSEAQRVSFVLRAEGSPEVLIQIDDAVFDRERGELLVACQRHYAAGPHDTVAEVRVVGPAGDERVSNYTILHRY